MRWFVVFSCLLSACLAIQVKFDIVSGNKLRIKIADEPGMQLAAVHYNINTPLSGVKVGKWNYDINSKAGGWWSHINNHVSINNGDKVYYWVYVLKNGRGSQITDRSWTVRGVTGGSSKTGNTGNTGKTNTGSSGSSVKSGKLRLVFEDNFNSFDKSKWDQDITLGGGGNWEFQAYTNLKQNTYTKNGKLYLMPTLTSDKYGEAFLTNGVWDVKKFYGSCTQSNWYGCLREGKHGFLNPAMSSKIMSKVAIKYGRVEVKAKLPRGDWLWPAIWMLPRDWVYGGWPRSGEIDIMEAIGNRDFGTRGIQYMGSTLHWGTEHVNKFSMTHASTRSKTTPTLADGIHTYRFDWDKNGMDFYLDGARVLSVPTPSQGFWNWGGLTGTKIWPNKNSPFDQKFYLVLNVAVGGTNGFIPDNVKNGGYDKPWTNQDYNGPYKFWRAKNLWYPTWKGEDAAMQIESVKMWEKA